MTSTSTEPTFDWRVPENRKAVVKSQQDNEDKRKAMEKNEPVKVTYKGKVYAVPKNYADTCDCRGELIDVVKELYNLEQYAEDYEDDKDDEYYGGSTSRRRY